MLAYAPTRRLIGRRSPVTLSLVIGAHVALVCLALSAKMIVDRHRDPPIKVFTPLDPPPPPTDTAEPRPHQAEQPTRTQSQLIVPLHDPLPPRPLDQLPPLGPPDPNPGSLTGSGDGGPVTPPQPIHLAARFITPAADIEPPYPPAKRTLEEEATLQLRLAIAPSGRVVRVDPVSPADSTFLAAARSHILAHWRYAPARDGDTAVASSTIITLRFRLED